MNLNILKGMIWESPLRDLKPAALHRLLMRGEHTAISAPESTDGERLSTTDLFR